jgi:aspartate-semialdehyde dehydrogenase
MTRISDSGLSVAVVGATGQVGGAMIDILEERGFPVREIRAFAAERQVRGVRFPDLPPISANSSN